MEPSLVSAAAALAGAAIGGAASILGSWVVHRGEVRAQWIAHDRLRRQELYREFIEEAARCYIDALQHTKPDVASLVVLYAKMSRMRVTSTARVLAAAEEVLRRIVRAYSEPPLTITTDEVQAIIQEGSQNRSVDALRDFSEACRAESDSLRAQLEAHGWKQA
jgi:hypothetical protein